MYLLVFGALMLFGAGEVLAQDPPPFTAEAVKITEFVKLGDVFTTLTNTVGKVVVGAVGLSLSLFVVYFCLRQVKRGGR